LRNGNNIRHLPKDFGLYFINIKELRLDENDIEELPQCFGEGMPELEILDLYCNVIQYLPDSLCKLKSLRQFSIGMNCLKKLPEDFGNLTALEELRLELNEVFIYKLLLKAVKSK
jgi:Leucine-rich repeat (LRR) protein